MIVILIRLAQRSQWQGSRAARYQSDNGQAADAANEAAPPPGKVTRLSRVGLTISVAFISLPIHYSARAPPGAEKVGP